jgi:hypothetical protein
MRRKILKTYPHLEELDNYALKIMELLMKTYPSWAALAQVGAYKDEKYLEVNVPAPFEPTLRDLIITTSDDDLTVHFDWYHAHFGRWYKTPSEAFDQACIFIDRILREDFIVGIKKVGGKWVSSGGYTPDMLHEIKAGEISYTRSWKGTYNRQFE